MANTTLISRREFVSIIAAVAVSIPLKSFAQTQHPNINFKEPWLTLAEVQQHLFPQGSSTSSTSSTSSIGAMDIQALEYLRATMDTPDFDPDETKLIHNGVGWLNDLSEKQYAKKFIQLDHGAKEKILRQIENSRAGERWLSTLLTYLLEALLTDPIYSGNPNGIGWKWLQHQPGFPRPPENKKYFKLDRKRFRRTKA